jgi:hypothetical protein
VLLLDCCYGGAFGEGVTVRAAGPVNVMDSFPASRLGGGRGRAVISASSAIEYAFEGTTLAADEQARPSVFTSAVVDGLRTGEADRDEDGLVSLDELYDYVFDRVRAENPKQTPGRDVEMAGDLFIARSRRRRLQPAPIPEAVAAALKETNPTYRRGAVSELRDRLLHDDPAAALGALQALREVVRNDTKAVADDAAAAIAAAVPVVVPSRIDFPSGKDGSGRRSVTVEVRGPALAREITAEADGPLEASVQPGGRVVVTLPDSDLAFAGEVTITSPVGSTVVPVTADIAMPEAAPAESQLIERRVTPVVTSTPDPPVGVPAGPAVAAASLRGVGSDEQVLAPAPILSGRARRVLAASMAMGGLLVVTSYAFGWRWSDPIDAHAPGVTVGLFILAIAAFVASIGVVVDESLGLSSAGVVLGVSTAAGTSILTAFGVLAVEGPEVVGLGWWIAVAGQVLVILCGVVCLVSAFGSHRVSLAWPSRLNRPRVAAIIAGVAGSAVLVAYAMFVEEADSNGVWTAIMMLWALAWLAVGALAVCAHPAPFARSFVSAWALAAVSQPISDLAHLAYLRDSEFEVQPLYTPLIILELILLLGLVVVAVTLDRTSGRTPEEAR